MLNYGGNENCNYVDLVLGSKNCYLSNTVINNCENVMYSYTVKGNCSNVYNSVQVLRNCENIYSSRSVFSSYNIFYSRYIQDSSDIWFSHNLIGCNECICSDNLQNKSYHIDNQAYEKEEYFKKKKVILADKSKYI